MPSLSVTVVSARRFNRFKDGRRRYVRFDGIMMRQNEPDNNLINKLYFRYYYFRSLAGRAEVLWRRRHLLTGMHSLILRAHYAVIIDTVVLFSHFECNFI